VATGGYAQLIARKLPEIEAVHPNLTLEGLRIVANRNPGPKSAKLSQRNPHRASLLREKRIFAVRTAK